jgi:hypothetical protein
MKIINTTLILCSFLLLTAKVSLAEEPASPWVTPPEIVKAVKDTYQQEFGHILPDTWASKVKISGEVRAAVGVSNEGDLIFTRANMDLNERNWRVLNSEGANARVNTYDPGLYSRLKVVVDAAVTDAVAMHLNVTVDPWSYVGKTEATTVTGSWGNDSITFQHLFWGNSRYAINRSYTSNFIGDGVAWPEVKLDGSVVPGQTITSSFGDTFTIPDLKVNYAFQPIREFWVDTKLPNEGKLRVFPMAYSDQALTTDDPLQLSNHTEWWAESPWIDDYKAGHLDSTAVPQDYYKGYWDRSLAYMTRDSDGQRLTALRGVSLDMHPTEDLTVQTTVASPKSLWQDYGEITALPAALRVKQYYGDKMYVGGTHTTHLGLVEKEVDKANFVNALDTGVLITEGIKATAQVSQSISRNDWLNADYRTKKDGNAYYAAIEAISDAVDPIRTPYAEQKPSPSSGNFFKTRAYFARMDNNFEASLSNYHNTRQDAFWGRHLTYYPSPYRKLPGVSVAASLGEEDVRAFEIGDGIDAGRKVIGWRGNTTLVDGKLEGVADIRHVTDNNDKKIEDVYRNTWNYKVTDTWHVKALGILHNVPRTKAGIDPFISSGDTGEFLNNDAITEGNNANLRTGALGTRYEFASWGDISQTWEHSNDMTLGSDNFPRGLYNSSFNGTFVDEYGRIYRAADPLVYNQGIFPQAPYAYHNIFKTVLHLQPTDIWDVYFDYTRNPNKFASQNDDNMNHYGFETTLVPTKTLGFYGRYTIAQGYNLNSLNSNPTLDYQTYHNMYLEGRYIAPKDNTFSLSYGVGPAYVVSTSSTNPFLEFYATPTLSTEHIIRLTYNKKF